MTKIYYKGIYRDVTLSSHQWGLKIKCSVLSKRREIMDSSSEEDKTQLNKERIEETSQTTC